MLSYATIANNSRAVTTFDYINHILITLPLTVYEGTWTILFPLVAMHHHDLVCA